MRSGLKKCVPPCLQDWARARFSPFRIVSAWPQLEVGGWTAAAQAASQGYQEGMRRMAEGEALSFLPEEEPAGWLTSDPSFHHRMVQFSYVAARAACGKERLRILDYGGGFGAHAHAVTRMLPNFEFEYTVCELPGFCQYGQKLNPGVRFVSSLAEAGTGFDLVYASGSVQYSRDWRELVVGLCAASRGSVYVTRSPFIINHPSFVVVQRAYGTEYPGWVLNYREFVNEVAGCGLSLQEVMLNGQGFAVRGAPEPNMHLGLLFERTGECRDKGKQEP